MRQYGAYTVRLGRSVAWVVVMVAGVYWKSLMLFGTLRLSLYRSGRGSGYALGIDAAPEATLEILCDASLLLSGRERAKSERGHTWKRADGCVAIDGGIGGRHRCGLYIPLSLPIVSRLRVQRT